MIALTFLTLEVAVNCYWQDSIDAELLVPIIAWGISVYSIAHVFSIPLFSYTMHSQIQCGAVITQSIFSLILPVRARYGCLSWIQHHSASVSAITYVISYNIGLHYNGTQLYYKTKPELQKQYNKITTSGTNTYTISYYDICDDILYHLV